VLTYVGVLINVMNCILLRAFVGGHIDCKNTDGRKNVKFVHLIAVCSFHSEDCSDCILLCLSFHWHRLGPIPSPLDHVHTLITSLSILSQFLQQSAGMSQ